MKKINWGIIGLGNIAEKFAEGFNFSENANLLSVSSYNEKKLKKFKKKFSLSEEYCFNNYEDLFKYIKNLSDQEYLEYLNSIEKYLNSTQSQQFKSEVFAKIILNAILDTTNNNIMIKDN